MKISEVIHLAGLVEKGNVMEEELAVLWLSELDGMIQRDIMLHAPEGIVRYSSVDDELLLKPPDDGVYVDYLVMKIRQQQQEFEGYQNAQAVVDEKLRTFRRWYVQHYRPADSLSDNGAVSDPGTWGFAYITAYGLAVQQGYRGTLNEWLESLKGEAGEAARMRYDEEREMVQWGVGEQWYDLFTLSELRDPAVDAIIAQAEAAAEAAEGSARAAQTEAQKAQQSMERAGLSAQQAGTSAALAEKAGAAAQEAAADALGYAEAAEVQAAAAKRSEDNSRLNLHEAEVAAQMAQAAAKRAEEAATGAGSGGGGGGYIASDEPPKDTRAMWIDTSEPDEAVALGATVVETEEGVEICATDELGTTRATVRHGRDGAPGTTPAKGVDYFTPAEVEEIARKAAGMVEVPSGSRLISSVTVAEEVSVIDLPLPDDREWWIGNHVYNIFIKMKSGSTAPTLCGVYVNSTDDGVLTNALARIQLNPMAGERMFQIRVYKHGVYGGAVIHTNALWGKSADLTPDMVDGLGSGLNKLYFVVQTQGATVSNFDLRMYEVPYENL